MLKLDLQISSLKMRENIKNVFVEEKNEEGIVNVKIEMDELQNMEDIVAIRSIFNRIYNERTQKLSLYRNVAKNPNVPESILKKFVINTESMLV